MEGVTGVFESRKKEDKVRTQWEDSHLQGEEKSVRRNQPGSTLVLDFQPPGRKEGWAPRNWCFRIVVLGKTRESPLDSKETKPVHPKGNQPWTFIGRTVEVPMLWPPDVKRQLIRKTLMLVKIEGKRRRGWQKMKWLDSITKSMDMHLSKLQEMV